MCYSNLKRIFNTRLLRTFTIQMYILILQEECVVNNFPQTNLTRVFFCCCFFKAPIGIHQNLYFAKYDLENALHFRSLLMIRMIVNKKHFIDLERDVILEVTCVTTSMQKILATAPLAGGHPTFILILYFMILQPMWILSTSKFFHLFSLHKSMTHRSLFCFAHSLHDNSSNIWRQLTCPLIDLSFSR